MLGVLASLGVIETLHFKKQKPKQIENNNPPYPQNKLGTGGIHL